MHDYEVIIARKKGELLAYAIFTINGHVADLIDIFGQEAVMKDLLLCIAEILRKRKIFNISATVLEGSSLIHILQKSGFYFRENSHYVAPCAKPENEIYTMLMSKNNWFMNYVDFSI